MNQAIEATVLIIGAGPVGLSLALDLASRGVDVVVAEIRRHGEPPSVKCNHVSARSMEIFRRLGIAAAVRNAGLPEDHPHDVSYRTTTTGLEMTRIPIPARGERFTAKGGPDTWWPTPEPPHRINQIYLEPILFEHAARNARIRILNRTQATDLMQQRNGVVTSLVDLESGNRYSIRSRYMIGCDGGRSMVRKAIGARFVGDAVVQRVQSTYIRAPGLVSLMKARPAWGMFSLNPRRSGNVYAIDGKQNWLIHNYLRDEEPDFDSVDRDWAIRMILGVGPDFEYEVLSKEDWYGRRLVADKFRDRRVFICGDAAHLWVPYAGYGMNAGIADAANLAWILAAHLQGWAPESILEAHEAERLPITEQVSHFAMNHAHKMARQRGSVPDDIEDCGPEGERNRAELGKRAYELNVQQYCCGGLNFGYFYDKSPIIVYDGQKQPGYSMYDFEPSTVPGCRTPHFWLEDGRSLYDAMGEGYTLLRLDPCADASVLVAAARAKGVPFSVLDVSPGEAGPVYQEKFVLSRPDQHVAWRGNKIPTAADELVDTIRGARALQTASGQRPPATVESERR
jgi:2-polyprenyl-6-methoxyphenol hydroxylase-like FAD-dependent oxidoreductase